MSTYRDTSGRWMRTCLGCDEDKPLESDFYKRKNKKLTLCNSYFYRCRECEAKRRKDPEVLRKNAERRKRDAEADPQKELERIRRYRERLKADPRRHAIHLENRRIYAYLRREKAGLLTHKFQPGKMAKYEEHMLPARPLYFAAKKYVESIVADGGTVVEACETLETTDREYRRWLNMEQTKVRWETADRLLTNLGLHWWDVWEKEEVPEKIAGKRPV